MISCIEGKLLRKQPTRLLVQVGGMGFDVLVPLPTSQSVGEVGSRVELHTVLVVREDSLTLYGFSAPEERELFLKLIGVSGVGPKIALGALSGPSPAQLVAALREQDLAVLTRLPGIGKKTAERMAVELKDTLVGFEGAAAPEARPASHADAVAALVSLGYSRTASTEAVEKAVRSAGKGADVQVLVRAALTRLAGGDRTGRR
jgi:Holliday junction DNA helicase RuvA